jgi:hypothetical protein
MSVKLQLLLIACRVNRIGVGKERVKLMRWKVVKRIAIQSCLDAGMHHACSRSTCVCWGAHNV